MFEIYWVKSFGMTLIGTNRTATVTKIRHLDKPRKLILFQSIQVAKNFEKMQKSFYNCQFLLLLKKLYNF